MISIWMIEAAPWRAEVPMQSDPVSPPPTTTTCLPLALIVPAGRGHRLVIAGVALVLLGEEIHREMDAVQLAPGDIQVARPLGAAGQHDGVEVGQQLVDRDVLADLGVDAERHTLGRHLVDAAVDQVLFHLEVGDAVAQQAADAVLLLDQRHRVTGAGELLCAGHAGRAGTDHRDTSCRS